MQLAAGMMVTTSVRLIRPLGAGGMGSVWVAEHLSLRTEVVVKFMSAELAASEQAAARFAREAASAAQAKSPHVVQMHDHGITPDGVPYIVMERLEGRDLGRHLEEVGPLLPAAFATILDQIAKALRRAHERGIVHRDIKPDNVFLCDTDGGETFVKLLDFGIAKSADGLQGNSTSTGAVVGTPYYMSPEQVIDAKTIDFRSDLWSVGVLAFKALTGKLPFFADSFGALALAIHHGPIPKPSTQNPALPAAVDAWFLRACARDPEDRFASAREMADAFATSTGGLARSESTPPPKRARRKVPWRLIAGAGVVCVVVAAVATTYRAARRPRIRYCAFVEESVDGPRCALEVGAALVDKRFETYRITDVGGKVTRVEAVSFAGPFVRFWWDRARGLTRDIVRGDDGAVRHILVRDHDGNVEQVEKWSERGKRIDLVDDDGTPGGAVRMGRHRTTPRFGDPRSSDSDESLYTIRREFDAQGRITSERHFAAAGRPTTDAAGAYGYAYAFGRTAGIAVRKTVLGADGKPAADAHGASVTETADDGTPGGGDIRYFDIEGKPTAVDGVHHEHRNWNASQEQTDSVAFGLHDQKVVNLESGVCEERRDWDRAKRTLSVTWLDELGRQRPLKNETLSAVRRTYDERGREVLVDHLDAHGNRVYDRKEGAGAHRFTWDDRDHWVEVEFLDVAGALAKGRYGFARQVMKYDAHGLFIEQRLFDETGKLTSWRDGAPIRTVTRDERGRQIASDWFDADEHAVANIHGWAGWRGRYDRLGNPVELAFVGPDGHSSIGDEGYAIERRTYDDNGDLLTEAFLDASGAPTMHNGEYATQRVTRDDLGLIAQEEYLDGHGERILRKEGYAMVRFVRDRNGDVVDAAYFGKHDEPITREGGFAKKKTAYDARRHLVETALHGASGALTEGADRWAIERNFYDDRGLVVRREYLDADRKPKLAKSGSASNSTVYDARGNVIEEASQGVDGQPIAAAVGYATKRSAYDERDQLTSESLFGADGVPVAGKAMWSVRRLRYDELGNLVEEAFFDGDHRPIAPKDASYASVLSRFDARQRLIETAYYDGGGAPAKGPEGVAAVRYKRDAYGRATETAFVDGSGAPALSNDAKVVVRTRYDDAGRVIEELFTDGAGAAHLAKDGCAGRRTKYDRLGRKVEESCVGVNDGVAISIEGWASRRTLHDARGNAVDQSTYGADGVLRADKTGVARRKTRFDERNLAIETAFFGADEKPAKDRRGVQVVRFTYDDSGKQTKETSLDERGGVVVLPSAKAVAEAKK